MRFADDGALGFEAGGVTPCTIPVIALSSVATRSSKAVSPIWPASICSRTVSVASVEVLLAQDWRSRVAEIRAGLAAGLEPARTLPGVADVRVCGAIGVIECDRPVDLAVATPAALDRGVWLRPFRNLIYAMPPFICGPDEIAQITSAMVEVARLIDTAALVERRAKIRGRLWREPPSHAALDTRRSGSPSSRREGGDLVFYDHEELEPGFRMATPPAVVKGGRATES